VSRAAADPRDRRPDLRSRRLPQLGKGIGEGIRNFKQSIRGEEPGDDNKKV